MTEILVDGKTYAQMRDEFRSGRNIDDAFLSLDKAHDKIRDLRKEVSDRDKTIEELQQGLDKMMQDNSLMEHTLERSIFFITGEAPQQAEKMIRQTLDKVRKVEIDV